MRLGAFAPWPSRVGWAALAIVLLGAIAYANSLQGAFIFDDLPSIRDNLSIRHLWPLSVPLSPPGSATVTGRPVVNLSLAFSYLLSGAAPWGHHLVNLLIHLLAGLTLFGLVRRTLLLPRMAGGAGENPTPIAAAIATIWTVHPLTTEAVTYTIQRAESLMGLFYLLTLYCFVRYFCPTSSDGLITEASGAFAAGAGPKGLFSPLATPGGFPIWKPGFRYPIHRMRLDWLCVVFCWLGMATKEVMVSAPVFVLLYDRIFLASSWREIARRRRPLYAGLFASWLALTACVASSHNRGGTAGFGIGVSWSAYVLTQFPALARYLRLAIFPAGQVFDYGTFWISSFGQIWTSVLLLMALAFATLWALKRKPAAGYLGLIFFALLAPTSLIPGVSQMIVEHRMYLALAAVVAAVVIALRKIPGLGWACAAVALLAAALTAHRNHVYRSSISLWADTAAKRPANRLAHNILGSDLQLAGRLPEALDQYLTALRYQPSYADAQSNAGLVLLMLDRPAEAAGYLRAAVQIEPGFAVAHQNLGEALMRLGQPAEALQEYRLGAKLSPSDAAARNNLANALLRTGQPVEAVAEYRAALAIKPDLADAHYNLGNALRRLGRPADAVPEYEAALRTDPGNAQTHNNLANTLSDLGRMTEAIAEYRAALKFDPSYVFAHYNLAGALEAVGQTRASVEQYEAALKIKPDLVQASDALRRLRR